MKKHLTGKRSSLSMRFWQWRGIHFATNGELRKGPDLDNVSLSEIEEYRVFICIVSDGPDIIDDSSEIRKEVRDQPYAVNTFLGWMVYGPMGESYSDGVHVNFIRGDHKENLSSTWVTWPFWWVIGLSYILAFHRFRSFDSSKELKTARSCLLSKRAVLSYEDHFIKKIIVRFK